MRGRPTRHEQQQREQRFREHVAAGMPLREAARRAQLNPHRALEIVDDPGFWPAVVTLRRRSDVPGTAAVASA